MTATVAAGGNSANVAVACARLGPAGGAGRLRRGRPGRPGGGRRAPRRGGRRARWCASTRWCRPTGTSCCGSGTSARSWSTTSSTSATGPTCARPRSRPGCSSPRSDGTPTPTRTRSPTGSRRAPQVSLAFEPGTLQIARGAAALARLYRRAGTGGLQPRGGGHAHRGSRRRGTRRPARPDAGSSVPTGWSSPTARRAPSGPTGPATWRCRSSPTTPRWSTGPGPATPSPRRWWRRWPRACRSTRPWPGPRSTRCGWSSRSGTQAGLLHRDALEALLADAPPGYGVRAARRR